MHAASELIPILRMRRNIRIEYEKAGRVGTLTDIHRDKDAHGRPTTKRLIICENGKETCRTNNDMLIFNVTALIVARPDGSEERYPLPGQRR